MKSLWIVILASVAAATLYAQETGNPTETETRLVRRTPVLSAQETHKPSQPMSDLTSHISPDSSPVRGSSLAPSTWGLVSMYYGSTFSTRYFAGQINRTYKNTNSLRSYSLSYYPTITGTLRAVYTFDVSSLAGLPGPVWSSFIFDTRERPSPSRRGLFGCRGISLISDGATHRIEGVQYNYVNNAMHLDLYDAEEFENADPFANPELAYSGNNPLLTTIPVVNGTETELNIDVTAAVNADLVATVPTLGEVGRVALLLLLGLGGLYIIRRRRPKLM